MLVHYSVSEGKTKGKVLATFPAPLCVVDTQWGLSGLVLAQWGEKWGVKRMRDTSLSYSWPEALVLVIGKEEVNRQKQKVSFCWSRCETQWP